MQNYNDDETMPIPAKPNKNEGDTYMDETMPVSPKKAVRNSSMDETMPMRASSDDSLDQTMPMRASNRDSMDETMPMHAAHDPAPFAPSGGYEPQGSDGFIPPSAGGPGESSPKRRPRRLIWVAGGILLTLLLIVGGGLLGYRAAIQMRWQAQQDQVAMIGTTQFQLGMADLEAGRYEMARRRFEYIIQIDPGFPGAAEKLTEVMLKMASVSTPTPEMAAAPAATPTPDLRGAEAIYNQAVQVYRGQDWNAAIYTLDRLRDEDITYRTVEVDGMYYMALRFRGIQKIVSEGNLEGGMYDLAQAEQYGPIDTQAEQYRTWARYYTTGASFWAVDWPKVVEYFYQLYTSLPNLRDGSGMTVMERFRQASIGYGDQLMESEDYCMARDQYNTALSLGDDPNLAATAAAAQLLCAPPTETPAPVLPTATLPAETPTESPVVVDTPTVEPSLTPTP